MQRKNSDTRVVGVCRYHAIRYPACYPNGSPFAVNLIRLLLAVLFLSLLTYFTRGLVLPTDASAHNWIWLGLSGIVGFIIGDYFLFSSYPIIGSRMAMLIMTLAPPLAAFLSWIVLGETMNLQGLLGMLLVLAGISIAIWNKPDGG
ncbi:MAG: DMT family transporter, partial [Chlorobi bacterium]|nr:DMT family transporter [Chlorobiota bacterium]